MMAKLVQMTVLRAFYITGTLQLPGDHIEVSDAFGRELLALGKAVMAPPEVPKPVEPEPAPLSVSSAPELAKRRGRGL
jgi:hypothetical protein